MQRLLCVIFLVVFIAWPSDGRGEDDLPRLIVDLPIVDYPDNYVGKYRFPSMKQSLLLSKDFYGISHAAIVHATRNETSLQQWYLIGLFDFLTIYLPLGSSWLHEEWHRAVLSNNNIDSRNGIYQLNLFADSVYIEDVNDEDIIRLKRDSPADFVRISEAGMEGEYSLVTDMEKDQFFFNAGQKNGLLYWITYLNSILYVASNATDNAEEQGDFTEWVYDLFRPNEPPSEPDDQIPIPLTPEEQDYLKSQGKLAFLNLADSNLFGKNGFSVKSPVDGNPMKFNMTLRHLLTSFGYTVDANFFFKRSDQNIFLILHSYYNKERYFPGVEVELLDYPFQVGKMPFSLTTRLGAWLQPTDQLFRTESSTVGGIATIRVSGRSLGRYIPYLEVEGKSEGWVVSNVHLDDAVSTRTGVAFLF